MDCPHCKKIPLRPVLARQGVEVDLCDNCKGIWLDKGEIFHFTTHPKAVHIKLEQAIAVGGRQSGRLSPRSGTPLTEIVYPGGPRIDYCKESGGIWFDAGELKQLVTCEKHINISSDHSQGFSASRRSASPAPKKTPPGQVFVGRVLDPLPNLFFRSVVTLAGLYAVLGLVLITVVEFGDVPVGFAVFIGVAVVILQYLLGPLLMDISLRWLYKMQWQKQEDLPGHLRAFVDKTCKDHHIKCPRFGIIDDGAPQAFTYGITPNNARIVLSRGIMELLEPEEVEAVVAHELGHVVHWDMLLMTAAQLVPMLLYYVYRTFAQGRSGGGNNKGGGAQLAIALGAYVLYIASEYAVLWFSRTREYHADRFAANVTKKPDMLSSALVKIAYGLAAREDRVDSKAGKGKGGAELEAIGALGIFDKAAAKSLALTSYSAGNKSHHVDKEQLQGAMRWDFWNPWAEWYELHSTHPLVAKRLKYLSQQAMVMGQKPYVVFNEERPESYWDEFFVDMVIYILPALAVIGTLVACAVGYLPGGNVAMWHKALPVGVTCFGIALLVRYSFMYAGNFFPHMSVAALLKKVKVSAVRPVPCVLRGKVIGRGIPGYLFSEDFVMQDETGIIFLDYRQPLAIWEFFFSILKADRYHDREVVVEGWYHRSPMPYVKVRKITDGEQSSTSWVPMLERFTATVMTFVGVVCTLNVFMF